MPTSYGYQYGYGAQPQNMVSYAPEGAPTYPNYTPGYNPQTMGISGQVQNELSGINVDPTALNDYAAQAERTGPSAWAGMATAQNQLNTTQQQNQDARSAAGSAADQNAQLAQSGGLSSGARQITARDAGRNYLGMSQNTAAQGEQNQMQIGINDEQNRIQQLGALPGMENQAAQVPLQETQMQTAANQYDIGNQVAEAGRQNDYNLGTYNTQMQAWGANQQANAIANSGKNSGK